MTGALLLAVILTGVALILAANGRPRKHRHRPPVTCACGWYPAPPPGMARLDTSRAHTAYVCRPLAAWLDYQYALPAHTPEQDNHQ